MTTFDDRWRQLAAAAREAGVPAPIALPADLARRARLRRREPIPFLPARPALILGAAAALLSAILLPLVWDAPALITIAAVPAPPRLPAPPTIESPGHYLALARSAWKDLAP